MIEGGDKSGGQIGKGPEKSIMKATADVSSSLPPLHGKKEVPVKTGDSPGSHRVFAASDKSNTPDDISNESSKPARQVDHPSKKLGTNPEVVSKKDEARKEIAAPSEEREDVITDKKLAELITKNTEYLGEDGVNKVLEANQRFNKAVTFRQPDGSLRTEEHSETKSLLAEIPAYVEAAQAVNLDPTVTEELLLHTLNAPDDDTQPKGDLHVALLRRGLDEAAHRGEEMSKEQAEQLKEMITAASENSVMTASLYSYGIAQRVGLSHDDSLGLVLNTINSGSDWQVGEVMPVFKDALKTLNVASADPEKIKQVFGALSQLPEVDENGFKKKIPAYNAFKYAVTFDCSGAKMTANELLGAITARMETGEAVGAAIEGVFAKDRRLTTTEQGPKIVDPRQDKERFFIEKPGPLEHAALPYRTERSLNDGVRDLEKLTHANNSKWEEVSEGAFVFDPNTQTWYSHGGETEYLGWGDVRHTSNYYDISELSETPISFHIHLNDYADTAGDRVTYIFPTQADYTAVATMMENAQKEVKPRSFISTPLGITEFSYPNDSTKVREAGAEIKDAIAEVFSLVGDHERREAVIKSMGEKAFAEAALREVNQVLPPGCKITLHPRGVDLEAITQKKD